MASNIVNHDLATYPGDGTPAAHPIGDSVRDATDAEIRKFLDDLSNVFATRVKRLTFSSLPANYKLVWHKRLQSPQEDRYLYGHPSEGKFRSPNEFYFHVVTMILCHEDGKTFSEGNCPCGLCEGERGRQSPNQ